MHTSISDEVHRHIVLDPAHLPDLHMHRLRRKHQVLVTFLAGVTGIMALLLLCAAGGPQVAPTVGLYQLIGYFLLVISFILGLRVLAPVFRRG